MELDTLYYNEVQLSKQLDAGAVDGLKYADVKVTQWSVEYSKAWWEKTLELSQLYEVEIAYDCECYN